MLKMLWCPQKPRCKYFKGEIASQYFHQTRSFRFIVYHITFYPAQVMSVSLDDWADEDIESMVEVGGNASANSIYESYLPDGVSKPQADAAHEERTKFIRYGRKGVRVCVTCGRISVCV